MLLDPEPLGRRGGGTCRPLRPDQRRSQTKQMEMITFSVMDPLLRVRGEGPDCYESA